MLYLSGLLNKTVLSWFIIQDFGVSISRKSRGLPHFCSPSEKPSSRKRKMQQDTGRCFNYKIAQFIVDIMHTFANGQHKHTSFANGNLAHAVSKVRITEVYENIFKIWFQKYNLLMYRVGTKNSCLVPRRKLNNQIRCSTFRGKKGIVLQFGLRKGGYIYMVRFRDMAPNSSDTEFGHYTWEIGITNVSTC